MADYTPAPNLALLPTLAAIAGHHGKRYCYPAQATIRALHARHTGETMSAATLNRHLRALERAYLIHRQRRHRHDRDRGWLFRSTLYTFTRRANRWLANVGAALRSWAAQTARRAGPSPSLNSERQSTSLGMIKPAAAPSRGPPAATKEVALRACDTMRATLLKK